MAMKTRSTTSSDDIPGVIPKESPLKFLEDKFAALEIKISLQIDNAKIDIIQTLQQENERLKKELGNTKEQLTLVEKDVVELQQYIRRNHVEVVGIPHHVDDNNLEGKLIEAFNKLEGINIEQNDIEACHRLKQKQGVAGPARVIIRFVNRKNAEKLLKKNKELRGMNLSSIGLNSRNMYINCNLCPYNRMLWGKCKGLYQQKAIIRFWVYNGQLNIILNDETRHKIKHLDDLKSLFDADFPQLFK